MNGEPTRVGEVRAQLARARMFYDEGSREVDLWRRHTLLMACVYFARSVIELMREAAKTGALTIGAGRMDEVLTAISPRHRLLHKLRIRDFHHAPVGGPGYLMLEHEIKLPPYSQAVISIDTNPASPQVQVSGSALETDSKFFLTAHGFVQDELEPEAIDLKQLLEAHLSELEECIAAFARFQRTLPRS